MAVLEEPDNARQGDPGFGSHGDRLGRVLTVVRQSREARLTKRSRVPLPQIQCPKSRVPVPQIHFLEKENFLFLTCLLSKLGSGKLTWVEFV